MIVAKTNNSTKYKPSNDFISHRKVCSVLRPAKSEMRSYKHILKTRKFIDIGHTSDNMNGEKKEKKEMYVISHQISIFHRSEHQASYGRVKETKINNVRKENATKQFQKNIGHCFGENEHVSRRIHFLKLIHMLVLANS